MSIHGDKLIQKLKDQSAKVGVIGLGYVGLPLAMASTNGGFVTIGFDTDPAKIEQIMEGNSYIGAVDSERLKSSVETGTFSASSDFGQLVQCDVIVICVPTPLSKHMDPDLSFVENTSAVIAKALRPGQLVALESTTYPGTTRDVMCPILENSGLESGKDFFVGYSPEREDPGNVQFSTTSIPKIIAGDGAIAATCMELFYGSVVDETIAVSSTDIAEAVKITENVFRSINIALVNELKVIFDQMDIDVWEVINAAASKPFGYMPFYPGPGLGGHCIPIDPFYLTWKAREYGINTRFIELAGQINTSMPDYVIGKLAMALDSELGKPLSRSRVLIIGLAYKKNISDIRESPSLTLLEKLRKRGTRTEYHDPHVDQIPTTREHAELLGMQSVDLSDETISEADAVLIATDHDNIDYAQIAEKAKIVIDTRNVMAKNGLLNPRIFKA